MSAPIDVVQVLARIAKTNADFATTADPDFIVRVGESMLKSQADDLLQVNAAVAELIKALSDARSALTDYDGHPSNPNFRGGWDSDVGYAAFQRASAALAAAQGGAA